MGRILLSARRSNPDDCLCAWDAHFHIRMPTLIVNMGKISLFAWDAYFWGCLYSLDTSTHSSVPHTATVETSCLRYCSTNVKLHILVKARPSTPSSWPLSPTRLGIRPRDLGLPNKCTLGHCGLSTASRHKFASTSRHLLTTHSYDDTTALY